MDPKKLILRELAVKFRGQISERIISEMVDNFFRHGNTFLLVELINLRKEVESLREELRQRKNKRDSLGPLLIP